MYLMTYIVFNALHKDNFQERVIATYTDEYIGDPGYLRVLNMWSKITVDNDIQQKGIGLFVKCIKNLSIFLENLSSVPSTYIQQLITACKSRLSDYLMPSSGTRVAHTQMQ